jgi:hypothetical protein
LNLVAGPGAGKSTTAAGVFSKLKLKGINCELSTEFAKDKVWEESLRVLEDQIYILGKQHHKLFRLKDKVDVIVTDSPLFLCSYYGNNHGIHFHKLVEQVYHSFNNVTVFIQRDKPYNPAGRTQTEEEAREIDRQLKSLMDSFGIEFSTMLGNEQTITQLADYIEAKVKYYRWN